MVEIIGFSVIFAVFLMFLLVNVFGRSKIFGIMAGLVLLILGIIIMTQDLAIVTSVTSTYNNITQSTIETNNYMNIGDLYSPNPISFLGMVFILFSIYIIYKNALDFNLKPEGN